jgi:hypothetical protein
MARVRPPVARRADIWAVAAVRQENEPVSVRWAVQYRTGHEVCDGRRQQVGATPDAPATTNQVTGHQVTG